MTLDEAIQACIARGVWREPECRTSLEGSVVFGQVCDGTVVSSPYVEGQPLPAGGEVQVTPYGRVVRRCVPRATLDLVNQAQAASPRPLPVSQTAPAGAGLPPVVLAAGIVAAGVLVVWLAGRALSA